MASFVFFLYFVYCYFFFLHSILCYFLTAFGLVFLHLYRCCADLRFHIHPVTNVQLLSILRRQISIIIIIIILFLWYPFLSRDVKSSGLEIFYIVLNSIVFLFVSIRIHSFLFLFLFLFFLFSFPSVFLVQCSTSMWFFDSNINTNQL